MGTEEPELHIRLATMRSIELRRDTVRAVNLGVSGWIDAAGRVRLRGDPERPGYIIAEPSLRQDEPTLYARHGDTPMLALFMVGSLILVRRKRFLLEREAAEENDESERDDEDDEDESADDEDESADDEDDGVLTA